MGAHHAQGAETEARPTPLVAWLVIVPVAVLTLAAMVWMWPPEPAAPDPGQSPAAQVNGTVTALESRTCTEVLPGESDVCGTARVLLDGGRGAPREVVVELSNRPGAPEVAEGDEVVLIGSSDPGQEVYTIVDHQRATGLWVLVAAFSLALVAFGRWHGLRALAGLAVTFALLLLFVVPAILAGQPPVLVAIVGSGVIVLTVLYLTHGFALTTTVAVFGTLVSLVLTGLLSAGAVTFLHLTGITDDLSASVGMTQGVNTEGLLVAGIVIGSLGVLDDVTVTQAATVAELARANPGYGVGQLYRAGSRVGRSHIASVVNTIVLAYAGSSLSLLILVVASDQPLGGVVTDQVIAQEVVRSVVATLGLIAAVPLTTSLAALAARKAA